MPHKSNNQQESVSAASASSGAPSLNLKVFEDSCTVKDRRVKARIYHIPNVVTGGGDDGKQATSILIAERRIQGIDDPIYERNLRSVWENLPRGQARIFELAPGAVVPTAGRSVEGDPFNPDVQQQQQQQQQQDDTDDDSTPASTTPLPTAKLVGEIFGMRKFGYRESKYGYRDKVSSVVCIEKVNGECAHVSACVVSGVPCWAVGSKHVHIVVPDDVMVSDEQLPALLKGCYSEERFVYANKIARLFSAMLKKVFDSSSSAAAAAGADDDEQKEGAAAAAAAKNRSPTAARLAFLRALMSKHWTANAEAIFSDAEHLVDYAGANELRFFSLSYRGRTPDGLCVPPEAAMEFFKSFGLPHAKCMPRVKYDSPQYREQLDKVAKSSNFEGVVVYGSDEGGKVACVWKEKSYPYVMERIAREAICGRHMTGPLLKAYLQKRLNEQSADLRQYFAQWEEVRLPMLVEFAFFLVGKGLLLQSDRNKNRNSTSGANSRSDDPHAINGARSSWLTVQKEFERTSPEEKTLLKQRAEVLLRKAPPADRDVVMFIGPPGVGKSTLARSLLNLLKAHHGFPNSVWINQDECGGKRASYLNAIKEASADKQVTHILLDKCNIELQNRTDVEEVMGGSGPTVSFVFSHPEGADELAKVAISRVASRGTAHKSLTVNSSKDLATVKRVVYNMLENFDQVAGGGVQDTIKVDVTAPREEQLKAVWAGLKSTSCKKLDDVTDAQIRDAVQKSAVYEASLKH